MENCVFYYREKVFNIFDVDKNEFINSKNKKKVKGPGLYYVFNNQLKYVETETIENRVRIKNKKDYDTMLLILNKDVLNYTGRRWEAFNFKGKDKPKRFYELGTCSELAYEIIEFECKPLEAQKFKLNIINYKNGVAQAYRYKFTFYYMVNSKNIPKEDIEKYTKDLEVYKKYNQLLD